MLWEPCKSPWIGKYLIQNRFVLHNAHRNPGIINHNIISMAFVTWIYFQKKVKIQLNYIILNYLNTKQHKQTSFTLNLTYQSGFIQCSGPISDDKVVKIRLRGGQWKWTSDNIFGTLIISHYATALFDHKAYLDKDKTKNRKHSEIRDYTWTKSFKTTSKLRMVHCISD